MQVKLLCYSRFYDLTYLCVVDNDTDMDKVIEDWFKMAVLYKERLDAAKGQLEVAKMQEDFVAEFSQYFSDTSELRVLIGFKPIRENFLFFDLPFVKSWK